MTNKFILLILSGLLLFPVAGFSAQTHTDDSEPHTTFQVSFFPPLSTNGRHAGQYTNDISLNLLVGLSKNERAFAFAGLANIIRNNATGFQFAGLANYVGNEGKGLMFGGLANIVMRDHKGLQFGGLGNIVRGDVEGFQFGGLLNMASGLKGLQFGGLGNISRDVDGVQYAGLFNVAKDVRGVQYAGLFNIAKDVRGLQFGGLFNKAKKVRGAQFAGLVNIAEENDYPIGIINIIREGEMGIGVGYNELGTISLTFRSGGRVMYGIIGVGYNHKITNRKYAMSVIGGYGAHINILPWLRINNELTTESFANFRSDNAGFKTGYALLPAFRFGSFEIFGGPSVNYITGDSTDLYGLFPKNSFWKKESASRLQQAYIGWQFGAQFIF